jgi:hypothetical protein
MRFWCDCDELTNDEKSNFVHKTLLNPPVSYYLTALHLHGWTPTHFAFDLLEFKLYVAAKTISCFGRLSADILCYNCSDHYAYMGISCSWKGKAHTTNAYATRPKSIPYAAIHLTSTPPPSPMISLIPQPLLLPIRVPQVRRTDYSP